MNEEDKDCSNCLFSEIHEEDQLYDRLCGECDELSNWRYKNEKEYR